VVDCPEGHGGVVAVVVVVVVRMDRWRIQSIYNERRDCRAILIVILEDEEV
jgi:hypothetical protein